VERGDVQQDAVVQIVGQVQQGDLVQRISKGGHVLDDVSLALDLPLATAARAALQRLGALLQLLQTPLLQRDLGVGVIPTGGVGQGSAQPVVVELDGVVAILGDAIGALNLPTEVTLQQPPALDDGVVELVAQ